MPKATTTIKVSKELRDRLAAHAQRDDLTLAAVISRALDEAEARQFWSTVRAENATVTDYERAQRSADAALRDDLEDEGDDALSARDGW